MTIRNTDIAIWAGTQFIAGSKGLTVKNCRFENVGIGIFTNYSGSSDFYIADNYFIGRDDPNHLLGWNGDFWAQFNGVDGQKFPPTMASYMAVKALRPRPRRRLQLRRQFSRRHRHRDVRQSRRLARDRRPALSAEGVLGPAAGRDRLLQQLHDELSRQRLRDRRQHAQRARDAEHDGQFGVASDLQSAGGRRPGLLDPQHRLSRARRIDADDERRGGRALLQQHDPDGDVGRLVGERALAEQSDARRELRAGDLQREHEHELQLVGLQRLPPESRTRRCRFSGTRRRATVAADYGSAARDAAPAARGCDGGRGAASPLEARRFATLAEYAAATHQDEHSVARRLRRLRQRAAARRARICSTVQKLYKAEDLDFRLKPGSAAVDRGVALPNITDGFTGARAGSRRARSRTAAAALRTAIANARTHDKPHHVTDTGRDQSTAPVPGTDGDGTLRRRRGRQVRPRQQRGERVDRAGDQLRAQPGEADGREERPAHHAGRPLHRALRERREGAADRKFLPAVPRRDRRRDRRLGRGHEFSQGRDDRHRD